MGQCSSSTNLQNGQLLNQRQTYYQPQQYQHIYPKKVLAIPAKNEILIQHQDSTVETLKVTFFQYDNPQHRKVYRQIFKPVKLLHCIDKGFYIDQQSVVYYIQQFSSYEDKSFHKAVCMYAELLMIQAMDIANILVAEKAYIITHGKITQKQENSQKLMPQISQIQFIIKSRPIQATKLKDNQKINNIEFIGHKSSALQNKSNIQLDSKNNMNSIQKLRFSSQPNDMFSQGKSLKSITSHNSNTSHSAQQVRKSDIQIKESSEKLTKKISQTRSIFQQKIQKAYINIEQLGRHMKAKNIKWFDKEFYSVTLSATYWMNNMHKANCYGIKNLLIGKDGSINFVGIGILCENRSMREQLRDCRKLAEILLSGLRGYEWQKLQGPTDIGKQGAQKASSTLTQIQKNFPLSFKMIVQLRQGAIMQRDLVRRINQLSQSDGSYVSYKRYINGYIESFFSNPQNDQIVLAKGYQQMGIFQKAKPLIIKGLQKAQYQNKYTEYTAFLLQMLIGNQNAISINRKPDSSSEIMHPSSQNLKGVAQYKQALLQIYQHLSTANFEDGHYLKAESFLNKSICIACQLEKVQSQFNFFNSKQFQPPQNLPITQIKQGGYLKEYHYIKQAEINHLKMKYSQAQNHLYQGLRKFPESRRIFISLIQIFLEQGKWQKSQLLLKNGSKKVLLAHSQQSYISAKTIFTRSLCTSSIKRQYGNLIRAIQNLIHELQKQNSHLIINSRILKADLYFYKGMYKQAKQNYENCMLIYKSQKQFKSQSFNTLSYYQIEQSIGNCCFLLGLNQQALDHFNQAFRSLSTELQERRMLIFGNMGLVQASRDSQQANQTINYTLSNIKQHSIFTDQSIHYKFLSQRQKFYIPIIQK